MSSPFTGRPHNGVLVGITHTPEGGAIIRQPRVLKVGIGLPKGKAINVWIHKNGQWAIATGYNKENGKVEYFKTRAEAEAKFSALYEAAPICPYPRKIAYFTFTANTAGDGVFLPDWDAIEAHGSTPTQIPIVFTSDNPYGGPGTGYRMYSATEVKCKGDGVNALRVLSMAETDEEKQLATKAKEAGERFFPIENGCWTLGCKYAKPLVTQRNGKTVEQRQCTPHMDLVFQPVKAVRLGNTAYYHTTGVASISNVFSSLNDIMAITQGRLVGIPMLLTVKKFATNHNGQAGTAYMVLVEPTMEAGKKLIEEALKRPFGVKQLQAGPGLIEDVTPIESDDDEEDTPLGAEAIHAEFVDDAPAETVAETVQTKTEDKTAELASRLEAEKLKAKQEAAKVEPQAAPPQPAPPQPEKKKGSLF